MQGGEAAVVAHELAQGDNGGRVKTKLLDRVPEVSGGVSRGTCAAVRVYALRPVTLTCRGGETGGGDEGGAVVGSTYRSRRGWPSVILATEDIVVALLCAGVHLNVYVSNVCVCVSTKVQLRYSHEQQQQTGATQRFVLPFLTADATL